MTASTEYAVLEAAAAKELTGAGMQPEPTFIGKVVELQQTLRVRFGVMLVGPAAGGKSTVLSTLRESLSALHAAGSSDGSHQKVHTVVFNPKCVSMGELYGEFNALTQEWTDGLASFFIRQAVTDTAESAELRWTVFDGPVDALWIENMNTVLDDNLTLCLANAERIKLNHSMRMLFEVLDLAAASPATVSRVGMVYVSDETLGWRPLVATWAAATLPQHGWDAASIAQLASLCLKHLPPALNFVRARCKELVPTVDAQLVASLLSLYASLLPYAGLLPDAAALAAEAAAPTADDEFELISSKGIAALFIFCLTWTVGGSIDAESRVLFDEFVRSVVDPNGSILPSHSMVHDLALSPPPPREDKKGVPGAKKAPPSRVASDKKAERGPPPCPTFVTWLSLVPTFTYNPQLPFFRILVPTVDTVCAAFLLRANLGAAKPTMLCGGSGVGKSVVVQGVLAQMSVEIDASAGMATWLAAQLNFSAQTSAAATQSMIEMRLEKLRRTQLGPPPGKRLALFVDDVNMPALEEYGAAPPVELLRLLVDRGGLYDRAKPFWKELTGVTLVCACGPPGGGRSVLTPRFVRHHHVLCFPQPSAASLRTILSGIVGGFLSGCAMEVRECVKPLVEASIALYADVAATLRPIPAKPHYTFNLRDLSKVVQGVLRARPTQLAGRAALLHLWWHECLRTFQDRLVDADDRGWLKEKLLELGRVHWKGPGLKVNDDDLDGGRLVYAAFSTLMADVGDRGGASVYEPVADAATALPPLLGAYLEEYTLAVGPLPLVFFPDAIGHVCRLARVLSAPRGSAMLVGVGGSGKQSLTRFAAFVCGQQCFQIELRKGYSAVDFREDLKGLCVVAGEKGQDVTFLFCDSQVPLPLPPSLSPLSHPRSTSPTLAHLFPRSSSASRRSSPSRSWRTSTLFSTRARCPASSPLTSLTRSSTRCASPPPTWVSPRRATRCVPSSSPACATTSTWCSPSRPSAMPFARAAACSPRSSTARPSTGTTRGPRRRSRPSRRRSSAPLPRRAPCKRTRRRARRSASSRPTCTPRCAPWRRPSSRSSAGAAT